MVRERTLLKIFGKKLVSFKKLDTGEIIGTGVLNPLFDKLSFLIMILPHSLPHTGLITIAISHKNY